MEKSFISTRLSSIEKEKKQRSSKVHFAQGIGIWIPNLFQFPTCEGNFHQAIHALKLGFLGKGVKISILDSESVKTSEGKIEVVS